MPYFSYALVQVSGSNNTDIQDSSSCVDHRSFWWWTGTPWGILTIVALIIVAFVCAMICIPRWAIAIEDRFKKRQVRHMPLASASAWMTTQHSLRVHTTEPVIFAAAAPEFANIAVPCCVAVAKTTATGSCRDCAAKDRHLVPAGRIFGA